MNKDCFAYKNKDKCGVLKEMVCKNGNCKFYKTKEQYMADAEATKNILKGKWGKC